MSDETEDLPAILFNPLLQEPGRQGLAQNIRYTTIPQTHCYAKRSIYQLYSLKDNIEL